MCICDAVGMLGSGRHTLRAQRQRGVSEKGLGGPFYSGVGRTERDTGQDGAWIWSG